MENLAAARDLLHPKVVDAKTDWRLVRLQARVLEGIARGQLAQKKFGEANAAAQEAFALRERDKVRTVALDPQGQAEIAENRRVVASIMVGSARCEDAKRLYEQAAAILDKLVREHVTPSPEWLEQYNVARNSVTAIKWNDDGLECSDEPVDPKLRDMIAMVTKRLP